jgi:glycosyltransferase involved in cell wall biosynthesis
MEDIHSLVVDYAEYSGISPEAVMAQLERADELVLAEWERFDPRTPDELARYYSEAVAYFLDHIKWNISPEKSWIREHLVDMCKKYDVHSVLDYGCGVGEDGFRLVQEGIRVTFCDLPGNILDFVRFRARRHGLDVRIIAPDELRDRDEFGAVLTLDVLEHVPMPMELVRKLKLHLEDPKILFVTPRFERDKKHPQHLKDNVSLSGSRFYQEMAAQGFILYNRMEEPNLFMLHDPLSEVKEGLVSVLIPTYMRMQFLRETLESVAGQTYPRLEVIVVNDGGLEETEQIVADFQQRNYGSRERKILYFWKPNGGCSSALNFGLLRASGEYIARIDDDDRLLPGAITERVEAFREHRDVDIVASPVTLIDEDGHKKQDWPVPDYSQMGMMLAMIVNMLWFSPTAMVRRHAHIDTGLYYDLKTFPEDYEMWLRMLRYGHKAFIIPHPTAEYRVHSEGMTTVSESANLIRERLSQLLTDFTCEVPFEVLFGEEVKDQASALCVKGALLFQRGSELKRAAQAFIEASHTDEKAELPYLWTALLLMRGDKYQKSLAVLDRFSAETNYARFIPEIRELVEGYRDLTEENPDEALLGLNKRWSQMFRSLIVITALSAKGSLDLECFSTLSGGQG